ncbi:hypothetical protein [Maribacter sp. 2304DJ31-5]|uniref:hypothetical protein n=1 Tax=Maribacter sp. 2304DJ31-5 TaxID=3386273 RepID=UPI0039BC4795
MDSEKLNKKLHSKEFYPKVEIQDFPICGKSCYQEVRRRPWVNAQTVEAFSRLIA